MPLVAPILALLLAILLALWPVQWAARAVGARRSSLFWCGLALLGASLLHGLGLLAPVAGSLAAFLLSAAGFAAILGTDYLRGIGIAVLYTIFSLLLLVLLAIIFGAGAVGWGLL